MASQLAPYLSIDFDYLKTRRDLSSKWALGAVHESFDKFFKVLGEERRTPFALDQTKSFERVHASVAARISGRGLGADGNLYASAVLKDGDLKTHRVDLSDVEDGLRWADSDVKQVPPAAAKSWSFRDFFAKAIGISS